MHPTTQQLSNALNILRIVAETIRDTNGPVPEGPLYQALATRGCDLPTFERIVTTLVNTGVVRRSNHQLSWIDPQ
jgi:DNA-binding IclR family transcriptional regulator